MKYVTFPTRPNFATYFASLSQNRTHPKSSKLMFKKFSFLFFSVGKGMKPTMSALSASRDVKDILVMCWTFQPQHRPDFEFLSTNLEKVPKKRLARSPSHPVHLTRSAESTF